MDDSNAICQDSFATGTSIASVLGIKGSLRFRPHGSTQKPHVILRRVTVSDNSSDNGEVGRIVRFSLFAQKRIEVKPGKEILLTVASEDGRFENQPVVFEGDLLCASDIILEDEDSRVVEKEESFLPAVRGAIPPKMRRAWTKKADEGNNVISIPEQPSVTRPSIGIQVEPAYVSISMQTKPSPTDISFPSASFKADFPHLPQSSPTLDTQPSRRYVTLGVQTHESRTFSHPLNQGDENPSEHTQGQKREGSGSPMELDSSSPTPEHTPALVPELIEQLDLSPQITTASPPDASSSGQKIPPIDLRLSSGPTFSLNLPLEKSSRVTMKDTIHGHVPPNNLRGIPIKLEANVTPQMTTRIMNTNSEPTLRPHKGRGKQGIRNPFISAGFVTNFVGSVGRLSEEAGTIVKSVKIEDADNVPSWLNVGSSSVSLSHPKSDVSLLAPVSTTQADAVPLALTSSQTSQPCLPHGLSSVSTAGKSFLASQNAVASSSKLVLERTEPSHVVHERTSSLAYVLQSTIPSGPRSHATLSLRALEKSPATSSPLSTSGTLKRTSPPDPKSLAHISTGSSSNPLNIRPSDSRIMERRQLDVTKTLSKMPPKQPASKKRVIVGAGWPLMKVNSGAVPTANITPSTPAAPQATLPTVLSSTIRMANLSNVLSYSSPSPPSTPTPVHQTAMSNWKRVADGDPATRTPVSAGPSSAPRNQSSKSQKTQTLNVVIEKPPQPMSLQDRITPTSTQQGLTVSPQPTGGRDHLSRISDLPGALRPVTASSTNIDSIGIDQGPSTDPPNPDRRVSDTPVKVAPSVVIPMSTPVQPAKLSAPSLQAIAPVPRALIHPLPPKPLLALNGTNRGIKRERLMSSDIEPTRRHKRTFRWPTVDSNYTIGLTGEGELGVRNISFSSDGTHFALSCADRTIRIWNNRDRTEIARLSHNCPVVAVAWMDGDTGVVSLGEDGLVSKWTRSGQNHWQWAKVLDAGNERRSDEDQVCLAYARDRIAVSFPRTGVKVWVWLKGTWQTQRSILRQNVSTIKFVEDGAALVGGTRDGVLWYCEVPNGTLRAYAFLKSKINSLDLNPTGSHVLVGQVGGYARLIGIRPPDNKGLIEQSYSCIETEARPNGGFGALFATEGKAILFGSVEGCVLVWDRKRGAIVYGLEHEEDDLIQAVASFDGASNRDGCLVTGTKSGYLAWWSQPVSASQHNKSKRPKLA